MSLGESDPNISGLELIRTVVVPQIERGWIEGAQLVELNSLFSLGLRQDALNDPIGNIDSVRFSLGRLFRVNGDYNDALVCFYKLHDFIKRVQAQA